MTHLFSPLQVRDVRLPNRIGVSPMCQYSSVDGRATDWHLVHLGSRAVGGAGLVISEAAAVTPEGRISPQDLGLWDDAHVDGLRRVTAFVAGQGAVPGVQLAHAGRKASTRRPWEGRGPLGAQDGGWRPVAASAVPFDDGWLVPEELTGADLDRIPRAFGDAAGRAIEAGYEWIEVHGAHGYLLHSFLSPLSNHRTDAYGGELAGRARLLCETVRAIRDAVPESTPVAVRISATDWVPGGWDEAQTLALAPLLAEAGVDLVDCSSGGNSPQQRIEAGPGYQVPFAASVRAAGLRTAAVGMITDAEQADAIVREGHADLVLLARELLRDPYWPLHAARRLGCDARVPVQYERGFS